MFSLISGERECELLAVKGGGADVEVEVVDKKTKVGGNLKESADVEVVLAGSHRRSHPIPRLQPA